MSLSAKLKVSEARNTLISFSHKGIATHRMQQLGQKWLGSQVIFTRFYPLSPVSIYDDIISQKKISILNVENIMMTSLQLHSQSSFFSPDISQY